ncbi:MAG: nucleotidyl transferase AbiEii/AbiGii toxin family protein [Chloroflexota bacterium]
MNLEKHYRLATTEETEFYINSLYPLQDQVMEIASAYGNRLYLTGRTALARFHFQHRLSEDLDFFTLTNDLKLIAEDLVARLIEQNIEVQVEQLDVYFARLYAIQDDVHLKIDMVREHHLIGELEQTEMGVLTNSLEDIGTNKITAFEDRAAMKDILDLYYITQFISLHHLFALAEQKRVPVAYENLLTIHTTGISGMILATKPVDQRAVSQFVHELIEATEEEIKKKETVANEQIDTIVRQLLWDYPNEERRITPMSIPVLKQRIKRLALPRRSVMERVLA